MVRINISEYNLVKLIHTLIQILDVIEAFFRRKGNYIGEHKEILEYFVMHVHVYKMNTKINF